MRQILLDTETTGLDARSHRVIEIGCVELNERRPSGRVFHRYLNPQREVDRGAAEVHGLTDEFLAYSKAAGNDLSTPRPEFDFPGLKAGQRWCLCAARWVEAYRAGKAPKVSLNSTNQAALEIIPLDILKQYAVDLH